VSRQDPSARVQELVEASAADLLAYFVRRVEVREDAADLLSETLLVIWRRASRLPADKGEARLWMFGVARNVLSTHRRGNRRRSALHDRLRDELSGVAVDGQAEDGPDVVAAVRLLDPLDQELVRLVFWDGFTQAEAAALLGMRENTVRSRTHRARQRLREALTEPSAQRCRRR